MNRIAIVLLCLFSFFLLAAIELHDRFGVHVSLGKNDLMAWTEATVEKTMAFDYLNYQAKLKAASSDFTSDGFKSFTQELQKTHLLDHVQSYWQTVSATVEAPDNHMNVIEKHIFKGQPRWVVPLKLRVDYKGKKDQAELWQLALVVVPAPAKDGKTEGYAIEQWLLAKSPTPLPTSSRP